MRRRPTHEAFEAHRRVGRRSPDRGRLQLGGLARCQRRRRQRRSVRHSHRGRDPRPGLRPVLVDLQERRRPGRQGHGRQGRVRRARHVRHAEDGPADRRRRGEEAGRPRRLDPGQDRPRPVDPEGRRRGHPRDLGELRLGRVQGARRPHPRRPGRGDRGREGRRADEGRRRDERALHQPGSRQRRPRRPLQGLHHGPRRDGQGRPGRPQGPDGRPAVDRRRGPGQRRRQRHPRPRSDRRHADDQGDGAAQQHRHQGRDLRPVEGRPRRDQGRQDAASRSTSSSTSRATCRSCS